jgi:hypothetical protein
MALNDRMINEWWMKSDTEGGCRVLI